MPYWTRETIEAYDEPSNTLLTVAILRLRRWESEADFVAGKPHVFEFQTPRKAPGANGAIYGDDLSQEYIDGVAPLIVRSCEKKLAKKATIQIGGPPVAVAPAGDPPAKSAELVAYEAAVRSHLGAKLLVDSDVIAKGEKEWNDSLAAVLAAKAALDAKSAIEAPK